MSNCDKCGAELAPTAAYCSVCGISTQHVKAKHNQKSVGYTYTPHPHIAKRKEHPPGTMAEFHPCHGLLERINAFLAVKITGAVGTMWCAYLFAILAFISLPEAIRGGKGTLIAWIAQTFLQLVLLSIIIVGQKVAGKASDKRALATYKDAEAVLHEAMQIQQHLAAQDELLNKLIEELSSRPK